MNPITEVITRRYSVRHYEKTPLTVQDQASLEKSLSGITFGPMGSRLRFHLVAEHEEDASSLKGLGTYGFIKNPAGYIVGVVEDTPTAMEDFGYTMEDAILSATALGIGTCWLGGSFTQSSFAKKIQKQPGELIPAVTAIGYAAGGKKLRDNIRRGIGAERRLDWNTLFFDENFDTPLDRSSAGKYATALEMVQLAPSASNKQPWRVVRNGSQWHFYCQRTPGYGKGSLTFSLLRLADLQRLDVGIAMCHFDLAGRESGLTGCWINDEPGIILPGLGTFYVATWQSKK